MKHVNRETESGLSDQEKWRDWQTGMLYGVARVSLTSVSFIALLLF